MGYISLELQDLRLENLNKPVAFSEVNFYVKLSNYSWGGLFLKCWDICLNHKRQLL